MDQEVRVKQRIAILDAANHIITRQLASPAVGETVRAVSVALSALDDEDQRVIAERISRAIEDLKIKASQKPNADSHKI